MMRSVQLALFSLVAMLPPLASVGNDQRIQEIVANSTENSASFTQFTCRYTYTIGVVKHYADWKSGPYYDHPTSQGVDPDSWTVPASHGSELVWVRNGPRERLQERRADPGASNLVASSGERSACGSSCDELFDGKVGVTIDRVRNVGSLWEGPRLARSILTPFDYAGAAGGDRSLTFANLATRSGKEAGVVASVDDVVEPNGARLIRVRFIDNNSDASSLVEFWFTRGELGVPIRIRAVASGKQPLESNVFITDRQKVDEHRWFPYRIVSVREGKSGKSGPAVVEIVEVIALDLTPPDDEDFQSVLPKRCVLHLGDQLSSPFVNDVEKPIGTGEVSELIAIAKRVSEGQPRAQLLNDPSSRSEHSPAAHTTFFSSDAWSSIVNLACLAGCVIAVFLATRKRQTEKP